MHPRRQPNHTRRAGAKQLDDGIADTFVSVDATHGFRWCCATVGRFGRRAEAATATARQSRLVDRRGLFINCDSSSQRSTKSDAYTGPNNSVIALRHVFLIRVSRVAKQFFFRSLGRPLLTLFCSVETLAETILCISC